MKATKFFRGPFFWITVAITLVLLGSNVLSSSSAPETITTSQAVLAIQKEASWCQRGRSNYRELASPRCFESC